jgi:putative salt-induced outer membrane protein YdiY
MLRKVVTCFCVLVAMCGWMWGDEVVLKNGNRLTGTILKLDDQKLQLKTDFADVINIKWAAVNSFTADQPIVAQTPTQKLNVTGMTRKGDDLEVATAGAAPVVFPASSLSSLRSPTEQAAWEAAQHPGFFEGWAGGVNFGLGLARGNSSNTNILTGVALARATTTDKLTVKFSSVYSKDNKTDTITASDILGGIRYDHNITKKWFAYVSDDAESNDLQKLDLRNILGGGLGYHAINNKNTILDLLGGVAWTHESYGTGLTNSIFSPSAGEDLTHKFSARTVFHESLFIYPYVTGDQVGDFRLAADAGLATKINRWLAWTTTFSDRYVTNPLPGTDGNDLIFSTGLAVTLPAGTK